MAASDNELMKKTSSEMFYQHLLKHFSEDQIRVRKITMWQNPSSSINLELNPIGYNFLAYISQIVSYTYKINGKLPRTSKILLQLNSLSSPYYFNDYNHITLFGEQDSIMLALSDFDLARYIENQSM